MPMSLFYIAKRPEQENRKMIDVLDIVDLLGGGLDTRRKCHFHEALEVATDQSTLPNSQRRLE